MEAKLEVLGISFKLGRYQRYYDEGYVKNLKEGVKTLCDKYNNDTYINDLSLICDAYNNDNMDISLKHKLGIQIPKAGTFPFYTGKWFFKTEHIHIMYEDQCNNIENLFIRAHEEVHVLDNFGKLGLLKDKIKSNGFKLKKRLGKLDDEEKANIGAICALLARNYSPKLIKENIPEYPLEQIGLIEIV